MLYSSPAFAKYAEMKKTKDASGKDIIDPKASSQDFMMYLTDLQKAGSKSGDIQSILGSQVMLQWVNMQQAIKGFQDMGQINMEWAKQDPQKVADAIRWGTATPASPSAQSAWSSDTPPNIPLKPGTISYYANIAGTEAGKFGADMGKNAATWINAVTGTLGGFVRWVGEWAGPLGAGIAVVWLIYAGYKILTGQVKGHSGFFWSVMALLGGSGLMAGLKRFGIDIPDMTAWDAADKAKKLAEEAAAKAKALAGGSEAPKDGEKKWDEKPAETTGLTEAQKYLRASVTADKPLVERVNKAADIKWNASTAKFDDYINYIEKDLSNTPLSKIFPTDHTKSIFHDSVGTELSPSGTMGVKMLKRVMRAYLMGTGYDTLSGTGDTAGKAEKETFLKNMEITEDDIKTKKLSDILTRIQSKRSGGTKSTEIEKENGKPETTKPTETLKSHKIGGVDVEVGKNVQVSQFAVVYGEDWKEYVNNNSKLPKDTQGKFAIPLDSVIKIWDKIQRIGTVDYVEVKYWAETFYIW
jgi:hypothetical protein